MTRRNSLNSIFSIGAVVALVCLIATGCIKNNIPYPRIQPNIVELVVEDAAQATQIDSATRTATIYLNEYADIYNVNVTSCRLSEGARWADSDSIGPVMDFSRSRVFMIELYQTYDWVVQAEQTITRNFTVANQIGSSVIDVPARRVVVTLPETLPLDAVKVTSCKLASPLASYNPTLDEGTTIDLSRPFEVEVTDHGRSEIWTIYAEQTAATVTTVAAYGWTNVAWVYGEAEEGKHNTIEYRKASSQQWITVPDEWLTTEGGSFYARIIHLESLTEYVARAVSDEVPGAELTFTTGVDLQVPNSDFEDWWLDGKVWCPWAEGGDRYWDTGNKGATTLGTSNSVPTDDTPTGTGRAAKLETRFVGIGAIGKLAAGNIFAGYYVKTDGTNGILSFGRPFKEHPTKMRGYYKYHSAPISSTTAGFENLKNRPDSCIVWCALIDSDEPFEIRTNPNNRNLFNPDADYVVAYGKMECGVDVNSYEQFEFDMEYKSTSRVPKFILITASASKYGDYFTGGNGSVLYLDDLELLYDY